MLYVVVIWNVMFAKFPLWLNKLKFDAVVARSDLRVNVQETLQRFESARASASSCFLLFALTVHVRVNERVYSQYVLQSHLVERRSGTRRDPGVTSVSRKPRRRLQGGRIWVRNEEREADLSVWHLLAFGCIIRHSAGEATEDSTRWIQLFLTWDWSSVWWKENGSALGFCLYFIVWSYGLD